MKIVVCQFWTSNLSYGKYTFMINEKYCNENNYIYVVENNDEKIKNTLLDRAITWYKPKFILEIFETYNPDYILFMDADAIVCDFSRKIEEFIIDDFDIICNKDYGPSKLNAGVFIMKNNDWVKNFMKEWWDICEESEYSFYKNGLWHDQTCFGILMDRTPKIDDHIKILNDNVLNGSYFKNQVEKNFIFHAFSYGTIKNRTIDNAYYVLLNIEKPESEKLSDICDLYSTDKNYEHNYIKLLYCDVLSPLKKDLKIFIEIGIQNGFSVELWRDFFKNGKIVACDINTNQCEKYFNEKNPERIDFVTLDQSKTEDLENLTKLYENVDVILDDGSHKMRDQQITFSKLFKMLKPGGIYILEDLHTSLEVFLPEKSIFNWGDPTKTDTLTMLEEYKKTGIIKSDYMTEEEMNYLTTNIDSVKIHRTQPNWSITSIIIKK